MENKKINIAELLKDCPKGMELDCTIIDNVVFEKIDVSSSHHPIIIRRTDSKDSNTTIHLTKYGQYSDEEDYKCVIFPKGKTTWEGFAPSCKFKVGDKIRLKENHTYIYTITGIREKENKYECGVTFVLRFSEQDNWELVPNKFDINTLVPFESKVLVRDINSDNWIGAFYSHYKPGRFYTIGNSYYYQCIPYEGNEHLLDTSNDCIDYYKIWE